MLTEKIAMIFVNRCFLILLILPVYLTPGYLHAQPGIPEDPDLAIPHAPMLTSPDSSAADVVLAPMLEWEEVAFAESYDLQLAGDQNFTNLITDTTGLKNAEYQTGELEKQTTYYWRVRAIGDTTKSDWSATWYFDTKSATYADGDPGLPGELELRQNYPNPFNPTTKISYVIPEESSVRLDVYDITGRRVATLVNEHQQPGRYAVSFDAKHLASGVYTYRIAAGDHVKFRQATLVK